MPCEISYSPTLKPEEEEILLEGLMEEAFKAKAMGRIESFAFFIRDDAQKIVGGIKGSSFYGCLYVDSLWVAPELRKKGWGHRLMGEAEKIAQARRCLFMTLTTMDWEALPFYQKEGFHIDFTREGYEKNSRMYFLRKDLP